MIHLSQISLFRSAIGANLLAALALSASALPSAKCRAQDAAGASTTDSPPPLPSGNDSTGRHAAEAKKPPLWTILVKLFGIDAAFYSFSSAPRKSFDPAMGTTVVSYDLTSKTETILWTGERLHCPTPLPDGRIALLCHSPADGSTSPGKTKSGVWLLNPVTGGAPKHLTATSFRSIAAVSPGGVELYVWREMDHSNPIRLELCLLNLENGQVNLVGDPELKEFGPVSEDVLNAPRKSQFFSNMMIATTKTGEIMVATGSETGLSGFTLFGPNSPDAPEATRNKGGHIDPAWVDANTILYVR